MTTQKARDAVARIIDPLAFDAAKFYWEGAAGWQASQDATKSAKTRIAMARQYQAMGDEKVAPARAKADAILTLITPPVQGEAGDLIGVREAANDLLERKRADPQTVGYRDDLWACLESALQLHTQGGFDSRLTDNEKQGDASYSSVDRAGLLSGDGTTASGDATVARGSTPLGCQSTPPPVDAEAELREALEAGDAIYERCKFWPEKSFDGRMALLEMRNLWHDRIRSILAAALDKHPGAVVGEAE
jgi:hypothetical protein